MKQTLIFLIILTICGSLIKPPTMVCGTKMKVTHYLKGKLTHVDIAEKFQEHQDFPMEAHCNLHRQEISFHEDNSVYVIYYKK